MSVGVRWPCGARWMGGGKCMSVCVEMDLCVCVFVLLGGFERKSEGWVCGVLVCTWGGKSDRVNTFIWIS